MTNADKSGFDNDPRNDGLLRQFAYVWMRMNAPDYPNERDQQFALQNSTIIHNFLRRFGQDRDLMVAEQEHVKELQAIEHNKWLEQVNEIKSKQWTVTLRTRENPPHQYVAQNLSRDEAAKIIGQLHELLGGITEVAGVKTKAKDFKVNYICFAYGERDVNGESTKTVTILPELLGAVEVEQPKNDSVPGERLIKSWETRARLEVLMRRKWMREKIEKLISMIGDKPVMPTAEEIDAEGRKQ